MGAKTVQPGTSTAWRGEENNILSQDTQGESKGQFSQATTTGTYSWRYDIFLL
jgi:hypothetical protein